MTRPSAADPALTDPAARRRERPAGARSAARLAAVQALYQIEIAEAEPERVIGEFLEHGPRTGGRNVAMDNCLFTDIVRGVSVRLGELNRTVAASLSPKWPLQRLEAVLRAILRAGAYEIAWRGDVPPRSAINEYVELAHDFFTGREPAMVNGVLDHVAKTVRPDEFGAAGSEPGAGADEFALIARHFAPLSAATPGALELGDDAALIAPEPGRTLVATADAMVAGVHFLDGDPSDLVARKLLRVNLSDLAAMGAQPFGYLVTVAWPLGTEEDLVARFAAGLYADQKAYGVGLYGGDTVSTPGPLTLSLTALGWVDDGKAVRRDGARPGDRVYVTGDIGNGILGLMVLRGEIELPPGASEAAVSHYRLPEPRVDLGPRLTDLAHAMVDISDGLIADLGHVCEISGVGAEIEAARVPLSDAAGIALKRDPGLIGTLLAGGDEYELLFAAPDEAVDTVAALASETGTAIAAIGRIVEGDRVRVLDDDGAEMALERTGWRHF